MRTCKEMVVFLSFYKTLRQKRANAAKPGKAGSPKFMLKIGQSKSYVWFNSNVSTTFISASIKYNVNKITTICDYSVVICISRSER